MPHDNLLEELEALRLKAAELETEDRTRAPRQQPNHAEAETP